MRRERDYTHVFARHPLTFFDLTFFLSLSFATLQSFFNPSLSLLPLSPSPLPHHENLSRCKIFFLEKFFSYHLIIEISFDGYRLGRLEVECIGYNYRIMSVSE